MMAKKKQDRESSRQWRKDNPDKVKDYANMRYKRDREKILEKRKQWYEENKESFLEYKRDWLKKNREKVRQQKNRYYRKPGVAEMERIRSKTRFEFNHLKTACDNCGGNKKLRFHHLEPIRYDNFIILCNKCHLDEHGKEVVDKNDGYCVGSEQDE